MNKGIPEEPRKVDKVARAVALCCMAILLYFLYFTATNFETLTTSPCEMCEDKVEGMQCTQFVKGQVEPIVTFAFNFNGTDYP